VLFLTRASLQPSRKSLLRSFPSRVLSPGSLRVVCNPRWHMRICVHAARSMRILALLRQRLATSYGSYVQRNLCVYVTPSFIADHPGWIRSDRGSHRHREPLDYPEITGLSARDARNETGDAAITSQNCGLAAAVFQPALIFEFNLRCYLRAAARKQSAASQPSAVRATPCHLRSPTQIHAALSRQPSVHATPAL